MNKATFEDQGILRHVEECGEDPDLDSDLGVCTCSHNKEAARLGLQSLHYFADSQRDCLRTSPHNRSTYKF